MAAAVRGVLPALDTVPFLDWIFDSAGIQHSVKYAAVSLDLHLGPILSTEYRPGHLIRNQVIHNLLYFWGNCDNPVLPGVCLCTADERPLLAVIIERVQSKKLGGAEAEIALAEHIICPLDHSDMIFQGLDRLGGKGLFAAGVPVPDNEVLAEIQAVGSHVAGDRIFIEQAGQRLHILTGAFSLWAVVHAVL